MRKELSGLNTRRAFLRTTGLGSAAAVVGPVSARYLGDMALSPRFAYVGAAHSGIHVFAIRQGRWSHIQTVASKSPSCLEFHPTLDTLYAANEVSEHRGLPCGTLEAFSIERTMGTLQLVGRQSLSLSATRPRSIAISRDGLHVIVPAYGGGAYNVLPVKADGGLGRVSQVVKEIGSGFNLEHQRTAHPHTAVLDPSGRYVVSSDLGSDRINLFALEGGKLMRTAHLVLPAGHGPGHLAIHPSGRWIYVFHELDNSVSCMSISAEGGEMLEKQVFSMAATPRKELTAGAVTVHPKGQFLYTIADGFTIWDIDVTSGTLSRVESLMRVVGSRVAPVLSPDGCSVFIVDQERVLRIELNESTGRICGFTKVAHLPQPAISLALRFC